MSGARLWNSLTSVGFVYSKKSNSIIFNLKCSFIGPQDHIKSSNLTIMTHHTTVKEIRMKSNQEHLPRRHW